MNFLDFDACFVKANKSSLIRNNAWYYYIFLSISPKISEKTPKNENPRKSEIIHTITDTKPGAS